MLDKITPVILTYNESPNICRTLDRLSWAGEIIVVDSFSTDHTAELIAPYSNVRFFQRAFDFHASQWNFAIQETGINSDWVLALDADYVLTDEFIQDLAELDPSGHYSGYSCGFHYCIWGQALSGALYPPVTVLYRLGKAKYIQDGHTQRVRVDGDVSLLKAVILHDDRKSLASWLQAQDRYMRLEADVLKNKRFRKLGLVDKLRKLVVIAPVAAFLYCLLVKRGVFDGRAGLYYAIQRALAEAILSLRLLELSINREKKR